MAICLRNVFSGKTFTPQLTILRNRMKMRGKDHEHAKSLQQKLEDRNYKDPELAFQVNIGFAHNTMSRVQKTKLMAEHLKIQKETKQQREKLARLNKLIIPLDKINESWFLNEGPEQIKIIAEHYGIYQDLFGDAYFYPLVNIDISYENNAAVYRGNVIKPSETTQPPTVNFSSDKDSLWTLVLTNPDGHFTEHNAEYVHWFIGNIPGGDLSKGQIVWPYLQPFPPKGTGYHRMVFVLYKQEKLLDYSNLVKSAPCTQLSDRTFKTEDFYRERQDFLTPAGLAFYQTDYDTSLQKFFHNTLNMKEPVFEYDFPEPFIRPQEWYPKRRPFNLYLDKYREEKQIAKEFLARRLAKIDPFKKPEKPFPYPNALSQKRSVPSWLQLEKTKSKLNWGRANDY